MNIGIIVTSIMTQIILINIFAKIDCAVEENIVD